jgi:prepilin peptidase CpaA
MKEALMRIITLELLLILALYFDIRYMKVPNALNAAFIILGIRLNIHNGTMLEGLQGGLFSFICFFFVYTLAKKEIITNGKKQTLRILGAGDGKLMITLGIIMGLNFTILACLAVSIAWVIIIAPILLWKGSLLKVIKETYKELKHRMMMIFLGRKVVLEAPDIPVSMKIPFVIVIIVGINLTILVKTIL